jgi:hypothetical protein
MDSFHAVKGHFCVARFFPDSAAFENVIEVAAKLRDIPRRSSSDE